MSPCPTTSVRPSLRKGFANCLAYIFGCPHESCCLAGPPEPSEFDFSKKPETVCMKSQDGCENMQARVLLPRAGKHCVAGVSQTEMASQDDLNSSARVSVVHFLLKRWQSSAAYAM
ncbi:unnamed protein product [Protopolystoma xenopodis]|uniref:Uncharacterized protein n=1 Tax=Protopolystoma xenopodis TaxID=117903 RepID=A0A448WUW0_9PLAT|nr:unnamed protein product [Protopolystoma xenopodis]